MGLEAALQSVVASPSGASWAGGQRAAFPDGSGPSAGPCQEKKSGMKKASKTLEVKPQISNSSSAFWPILS